VKATFRLHLFATALLGVCATSARGDGFTPDIVPYVCTTPSRASDFVMVTVDRPRAVTEVWSSDGQLLAEAPSGATDPRFAFRSTDMTHWPNDPATLVTSFAEGDIRWACRGMVADPHGIGVSN
jgi:hypothetical protein